ncbi:ABC transporter permease [Ornithinimicrobium sp. LYQ92]|uniref:ABC transporter permease n=1 Tax=Serinicoccus sp. LYQ92 TaxID=3378798 RepID=UPI003852AC28
MSTPRPWSLVAAREIRVKLTDKNFLIGTVLTVLLILAAMLLPTLFGGDDGPGEYDVAVVDDTAATVVEQAQTEGGAGVPGLGGSGGAEAPVLTPLTVADRDAAETAVLDGDADAALVGEAGSWEMLTDEGAPMELEAALTETVRTQGMQANAEAAGTTVEDLTQGTLLTVTDLAETQGGGDPIFAFVIGLAFAALFYMAAIMFGMQIANSVVEEKQSRIVEILAAKIPVRQLLLGKVLGNTALAFGQIALIAAVSLVGLTFLDLDVALPGLAGAIAWYLPFFLLGFIALACVWAAAGALASRTEDLQTTTMPLTMVLVIVFIAGINLDGVYQRVFSFLPVASTIIMPMRLVEGGVPVWEPLLALAIVVAFCALTIGLGARLYERALLHTSGSLSWRKAMTMKN